MKFLYLAAVAVLCSFGYIYCGPCAEGPGYLYLLKTKDIPLWIEEAVFYIINGSSSLIAAKESKMITAKVYRVEKSQKGYDVVVKHMYDSFTENAINADIDVAAFVVSSKPAKVETFEGWFDFFVAENVNGEPVLA